MHSLTGTLVFVQIRTEIFEGIKILSNAVNQLLESRIGFWTSFEIFQQFGEFTGASGKQWPFLFSESMPVKASIPWMGNDLFETVRKVGSAGRTADSVFGSGKQAAQEVNAFSRQLPLNFRRNLTRPKRSETTTKK